MFSLPTMIPSGYDYSDGAIPSMTIPRRMVTLSTLTRPRTRSHWPPSSPCMHRTPVSEYSISRPPPHSAHPYGTPTVLSSYSFSNSSDGAPNSGVALGSSSVFLFSHGLLVRRGIVLGRRRRCKRVVSATPFAAGCDDWLNGDNKNSQVLSAPLACHSCDGRLLESRRRRPARWLGLAIVSADSVFSRYEHYLHRSFS